MNNLRSTLKKNSDFIKKTVCPLNGLVNNKIEIVQFHISDTCNLNCKHCSHFSPLCKPREYNKYSLYKDLKQLAKLTQDNPLKDLGILGGEPLLNKDITFYIRECRKLFPTTAITIISNGLLVTKMPKRFFQALVKYNVALVMTKYFEDDFYKPIIDLLKSYGVIYAFTPDRFGSMGFVSCKLTRNPKLTKEEAWDLCPTKNSCVFLQDGRLYSCPSIPFRKQAIDYFKENIPTFNEGIDIYMNTYNEIVEQLQQPKESCRYCSDDTFKCIYFHSLATYEKKDYIEE